MINIFDYDAASAKFLDITLNAFEYGAAISLCEEIDEMNVHSIEFGFKTQIRQIVIAASYSCHASDVGTTLSTECEWDFNKPLNETIGNRIQIDNYVFGTIEIEQVLIPDQYNYVYTIDTFCIENGTDCFNILAIGNEVYEYVFDSFTKPSIIIPINITPTCQISYKGIITLYYGSSSPVFLHGISEISQWIILYGI